MNAKIMAMIPMLGMCTYLTSCETRADQATIPELENRIHDLEINLSKLNSCCSCAVTRTILSECLDKTRRFIDTGATEEQKKRFVDHCIMQKQIWERRDP
jgi:hypothetical protein